MNMNAKFISLPIELVHMICLFTGKFVFDKNKKLKSIVNLEDFTDIKSLMVIHEYHKNQIYCLISFNNNIYQKLRFIQRLYSDRRLSPEERLKEEVLSIQNVDYNKQSYLFTKPSPIEEVMIPDKIPIDFNEICDECCAKKILPNKLKATKNPKKVTYIFGNHYYQIDAFMRHYEFMIKPLNCAACKKCKKAIIQLQTKKIQEAHKKKDKNSVKKLRMNVPKSVIKNFRRLN